MAVALVRIEQGGRHIYQGLSADTRPVSPPIGSEYFISEGGVEKYLGVSVGWKQTHDASGALIVSPKKLAMEKNIGTGNEYGIFIPKCLYTPVAASLTDYNVSGGVPGILIAVIMGTGQTGEITLKNGTTTLLALTPGANVETDLHGGNCNTDIRITTALSAGCLVCWNPQ